MGNPYCGAVAAGLLGRHSIMRFVLDIRLLVSYFMYENEPLSWKNSDLSQFMKTGITWGLTANTRARSAGMTLAAFLG